MDGWTELTPGSKLPNQCFSVKLGRYKKRFGTADEADEFIETTNQTNHLEYYECSACAGFHVTSKQRGGMHTQRRNKNV